MGRHDGDSWQGNGMQIFPDYAVKFILPGSFRAGLPAYNPADS
jgi:hypothetical protein